ncbi:hypothetical protein [Lactococcus lactis]|uniref:hypothetical protein n=1 Tax=Lactococcus lactis TaxID=1358 RepID=UPI000559B3A5|nr:hypothetical protein [Lactococcus lactis]AJA57754.1 hypothetical protein QI18_10360 [Lactococcus lactis subsp. lactis]WBM77107.1 hypothetical protein OHI04_10050 [Lactococcus lactis]WSP31570.1 hypothetical protein VVB72_10035 [Lactococcus lactis subsp. lactis]
MDQLIQSIITLGGFGYLNFLIYSRIDNPDFGSESDKKFMILLYSSMNYGIYLIVSGIFSSLKLSNLFVLEIIITIIFSVLITLMFPIFSRVSLRATNFIRGLYKLPRIENVKVSDIFFEKPATFPMYIFSIPDSILINKGYRGYKSGINDDFSVINFGFFGNEPFCRIDKECDLLDYLEKEKIEVDIYINFDKKIKIISFQVLAEEEQKFSADGER